MDYKSIKESCKNLVDSLEKSGIILSESQKNDIGQFASLLEERIWKAKRDAVRRTTERLDRKYREVFESVLERQIQHDKLASDIQNKITVLKESKRVEPGLEKAIDGYLDTYVESILPKKTIIDYDRMQKLERIVESVKDTLVFTDSDINERKQKIDESYAKKESELNKTIEDLQNRLNESKKSLETTEKLLKESESREFLHEKTKNLPDCEAEKVLDKVEEGTLDNIEKDFDNILGQVKEENAQIAHETLEINEFVAPDGEEPAERMGSNSIDEEIEGIISDNPRSDAGTTNANVGTNDDFDGKTGETDPEVKDEGSVEDDEDVAYETDIDLTDEELPESEMIGESEMANMIRLYLGQTSED